MTQLARTFSLLFLVLIFLISIGFSFFNTQQIALSFGFVVLSPQPLAVWVLSAFALGGVLGLALGAGIFRQWRAAREIERLRTELTRLEQQAAIRSETSR